jgi:large subunit ribosomal protein L24
MKNHIKVGDRVKVIAGSQKGILGNVLSIFQKNSMVILEGILPRIKYVKNAQGQSQETKKVEIPLSIHISNVMLWDKNVSKPSRIGYKIHEGKKTRYFKKSGNLIN